MCIAVAIFSIAKQNDFSLAQRGEKHSKNQFDPDSIRLSAYPVMSKIGAGFAGILQMGALKFGAGYGGVLYMHVDFSGVHGVRNQRRSKIRSGTFSSFDESCNCERTMPCLPLPTLKTSCPGKVVKYSDSYFLREDPL